MGSILNRSLRLKKAYQKNARFVEKVLTEAERARFEELSGKRKMEYLTGRWSAKEAFSKAMGTGIGPVGFQGLEILNDAQGALIFQVSFFWEGMDFDQSQGRLSLDQCHFGGRK